MTAPISRTGSAPAAMKAFTVTSCQLEEIRIALVAQRDAFSRYMDNSPHVPTYAYWSSQRDKVDDLLLLVAEA